MPKSSCFYLLLSALLASGCSLFGKDEPPVRELVAAPTKAEQEMFQDGIDAYDRGLFTVARDSWNDLIGGYPGSVYLPFATLKIADTYYQTDDFTTAATSYDEFVRNFPGNEAVPYARVQIANCAMKQYKDVRRDQTPLENAIKAYQDVLREHPNTPYAFEARRNIDKARELLAQHEAYVASFYEKQGKLKASASRFIALKDLYGDSSVAKRSVDEIIGKESDPQLNSELTALEGMPAGPVSGAAGAPAAPILLAANAPGEQEPLITFAPYRRARLASAGPTEPADKEVKELHLVQSLECEKSADNTVIIVNISAPVQYETARDNSELRVTLRNLRAAVPTDSQTLSCDTAQNISASLVESGPQATLKIAATSTEKETIFTLDRPTRLVVVLPNQ